MISPTAKQLHEYGEKNNITNRLSQVFAVYDKKACTYSFLSIYQQKGQAIRAFEDAVNDPNTAFQKHADDFQLFQIGEWNDLTGVITPFSNPVHVEDALNLQKITK